MKTHLTLLFACFTIIGANAANIYVQPNGSDNNAGTSWSASKKTIAKALATATVGDTVFVAQGTYSVSVSLVDGKHIFGGYNAATGERDLDRYPTVIDGATVNNRLIASSKEFVNPTTVDGLVLENSSHSHSGGAAAIYGNITLSHCIIRNCSTASSGGGVYMHSNAAIRDCIIELCTATKEAGAVYVSSGCIVENCIIRGCAGKFGAVYNNNGTIRNCIIHNCEPNDATWPATAAIYNVKGQVINCTVCNNYSEGGYAGIHSNAKVYNSVFWNNMAEDDFADPVNFIAAGNQSSNNYADDGFDAASFSSTGLSAHNNAADGPHFKMPTTFFGLPKNEAQVIAMRSADYSLTSGSALIDGGSSTIVPATDITGTMRPKGAGVDAGAYEYDPAAPIVHVTGVEILSDTLFVTVGKVNGAAVVVSPKNATNKQLEWTSDDPSIATVDANGAVTGIRTDTTILHVTTVDGGFTASVVVVVTPVPPVFYPNEVLAADTLYPMEHYTIPSYIPFLIAKEAARLDSAFTDVALITEKVQAMRDMIPTLVPKTEPYNMIANINGDPRTRMAFCWFTNEGITDGEVQLLAKSNATAADFEAGTAVVTIPAEPTTTKALRYAVSRSGIIDATRLPSDTKFKYVSHKALAEDLTPGTTYSWRVGYNGHWSEIAQFSTQDDEQGEYSFVYMTDSHIQDQEYVNHARWCATAVAKHASDARFCVFPGDFVETGTTTNSEWEWERWFEEAVKPVIMKMPVVPTDGNHDDSPNLNYTYHFNTDNAFNQTAKTKPQFDGITYSFVYGDVLFMVYSMQDYWRGAYDYTALNSTYLTNDVANWFREQCAAHPNTKYRIGLVHKGLFCGAGHCKDTEGPLFRSLMLPVMKECEIDVLLQGHDHCYEVIGPVNPDTKTAITSAIADREVVETPNSKNSISGYKGGTYTVDEGTLYFIGATCGRKRYNPYDRKKLDDNKSAHKVNNLFDLFTGMFAQPEAPCFTKITVKADCLEFNSYTADQDGNATLINTMQVKRTKQHTVPQGFEDVSYRNVRNGEKFIRDRQIYIRYNGKTYNMLGEKVE